MTYALEPHFFRHEYGRLVAMLSRRVGLRHLEIVEDAVQSALVAGLECWTRAGLPENPSAWLFRVAHNHVVGELRQRVRRERLVAERGFEDADAEDALPTAALAGDLRDDLLRMLFVCCDDAIPVESQLVIALKTLCGFDVREIAARLFLSEANVYKRLGRARQRLRELPLSLDGLSAQQLTSRMPAVRAILYLLFTEGYLSSSGEEAIRRELCDEAMRLAALLAEHPAGGAPETYALVALMHLHAARMTARRDASGGLLLLEEQDRSLWDPLEIQAGLAWLARSAAGDVFSRYHAEAGIAAEHCLAPSFAETRWDRIVECYTLLERLAPSALHTLNRAVAVAEWRGPEEGLAILEGLAPPSWLEGSYLWMAVLADLHRRRGDGERARRYRDAALASAPSVAVRDVLERRLQQSPHGDGKHPPGKESNGAMAYDEKLAARIRLAVGPRADVTEKKMFGGIAFMLDGKMFIGIVKDDLMVRVGPEGYEAALAETHVRPMDFTGRPMNGYVYVGAKGLRTDKALERWVDLGEAFVATLYGAKKSRATRRSR